MRVPLTEFGVRLEAVMGIRDAALQWLPTRFASRALAV
jgi:hypothetical protein